MVDYADLADAVREAYAAGRRAATETDDGGSCNMDGVVLFLPRSPIKKIAPALDSAGAGRSYKISGGYFKGGFMLNPDVGGQAAKRTRAAEAMHNVLKERGYKVSMFYMAD